MSLRVKIEDMAHALEIDAEAWMEKSKRSRDRDGGHAEYDTALKKRYAAKVLNELLEDESPRAIEPSSQYTITARGQCYGVIQPDPPHYLGEVIYVPMRIAGIEFKSIDGDKPGKPIGLLVRVIDPEPEPKYLEKPLTIPTKTPPSGNPAAKWIDAPE